MNLMDIIYAICNDHTYCGSSNNSISLLSREHSLPPVEADDTEHRSGAGSSSPRDRTDDNNNHGFPMEKDAVTDDPIKSILKNSDAKIGNCKSVSFNFYASVRVFEENFSLATKFRADHNFKIPVRPRNQLRRPKALLSDPKKASPNVPTTVTAQDSLDQITLKDGLSEAAVKLVTLDDCSSVTATPAYAGSNAARQTSATNKRPRSSSKNSAKANTDVKKTPKASHRFESDTEIRHVFPTMPLDPTDSSDTPIEKHVAKRKLDSQEVSFEADLTRVARQAYECVVNGNHDGAEATIVETEIQMKLLAKNHSKSFSKVRCPCHMPLLNSDDITRIQELFPPDNYQVPTGDFRDLQCIRGYDCAQQVPDVNTVRCISNHRVHLDGRPFGLGCAYMSKGDYYSSERVNYLPVPSIWTPQHALMETAPCIPSPGIYHNANTRIASVEDSDVTDTDEENAIY